MSRNGKQNIDRKVKFLILLFIRMFNSSFGSVKKVE